MQYVEDGVPELDVQHPEFPRVLELFDGGAFGEDFFEPLEHLLSTCWDVLGDGGADLVQPRLVLRGLWVVRQAQLLGDFNAAITTATAIAVIASPATEPSQLIAPNAH